MRICLALLAVALPLFSAPEPSMSSCMSEVFNKRYSGYRFDATKNIAPAEVKEILESARLAPSSYNEQPWSFIVCDRSKNPESFKKALSTLVEFNQKWAAEVPLLIIVLANKTSEKGTPNDWAEYDTGAAAFAMMLKATSIGLMAHQMGGFEEALVRKEFAIPTGVQPMAVMAIGYPATDEVQPERKRKPLGDNFFIGTWGTKFVP